VKFAQVTWDGSIFDLSSRIGESDEKGAASPRVNSYGKFSRTCGFGTSCQSNHALNLTLLLLLSHPLLTILTSSRVQFPKLLCSPYHLPLIDQCDSQSYSSYHSIRLTEVQSSAHPTAPSSLSIITSSRVKLLSSESAQYAWRFLQPLFLIVRLAS